MKRATARIKLIFAMAFAVAALAVLSDIEHVVRPVEAFSDGPPVGHTGAPDEQSCNVCHSDPTPGVGFSILPPQNYVPGQTYQITVRHVNPDTSRTRWGFQLTSLAGATMAGTLDSTDNFTQIVGGVGRDYAEQTLAGSFPGMTGGAQWVFNWTAPSTDVGPVTFYAAGNQANGDFTASGDRVVTASATSQPASTSGNTPFDFDGDGKADLGIFRPSVGEWWINRSGSGSTVAFQFGTSTDRIVPADYTGDGKTDIAIWRPSNGEWFVLRSEDNSFYSAPFGANADIPAPADYDNDGEADLAVFRPSSATWFIKRSGDEGTTIQQFGANGDLPVAADYDGDGKADIAIYRPSVGEWWLNRSTAGVTAYGFGSSSDKAVPGDYTGDGKWDAAFWRPSTGEWYVLRSEDLSFYSAPFGTTGDIPAPGDYDGDGKFDLTVFRPSSATWFSQRTSAGTLIQQFGASGDQPVPNAFVR